MAERLCILKSRKLSNWPQTANQGILPTLRAKLCGTSSSRFSANRGSARTLHGYWRGLHQEHRARVDAESKRKATEAQAVRERVEKDAARRGWVADGGDEATFEKAWPSMRDEARGERVLEAGREAARRAREEQRRISAL